MKQNEKRIKPIEFAMSRRRHTFFISLLILCLISGSIFEILLCAEFFLNFGGALFEVTVNLTASIFIISLILLVVTILTSPRKEGREN